VNGRLASGAAEADPAAARIERCVEEASSGGVHVGRVLSCYHRDNTHLTRHERASLQRMLHAWIEAKATMRET